MVAYKPSRGLVGPVVPVMIFHYYITSQLPLLLLCVDEHEAKQLGEAVEKVEAEFLLGSTHNLLDSFADFHKVTGLVADHTDKVANIVVVILPEATEVVKNLAVQSIGPWIIDNAIIPTKLLETTKLLVFHKRL